MNPSVISALAALVGAAIGGLTSVLANWLSQRTQVRAEWRAHDRIRRQDLYKDFIDEATGVMSTRCSTTSRIFPHSAASTRRSAACAFSRRAKSQTKPT
jgi:hypothetical protein